jgi:hypothetical protein
LLALAATCPACGLPLDEVGKRMGATLDEASAFGVAAQVLMRVEDRLGLTTPSITDDEVLSSKGNLAPTLRDLARLVSGYVPSGAGAAENASRLVLEAAAEVAGRPVAASDMDRPLLQALHIRHRAD